MKIWKKIFLLVFGLGVSFIFLFVVIHSYSASKKIKELVFSFLSSSAESKGESVELYLEEKLDDVEILAKSPSVRRILDKNSIDGVREMKNSVEKIAQNVIDEADEFIRQHPDMTMNQLQQDPDFRKIAIQKVGLTGYTAITNYDNLTVLLHKNESLEGVELSSLSENLSGFWSIMRTAKGGVKASGFYDWIESDGRSEKKYMSILVGNEKSRDGIGYSVASTTYVSEYDQKVGIFGEANDYLADLGEIYNYDDVYIVSLDGDVWWSVTGSEVVGTNVLTGRYKDTNFARAALNSMETESKVLTDYDLIGSEAFYFAAAPIYDDVEEKLVGSVVIKENSDKLNEVLGLTSMRFGESGETFLVGRDRLMRSNSRFSGEEAVMRLKVDTPNVNECFNDYDEYLNSDGSVIKHEEEVLEFDDYRGIRVLGAHAYVEQMGWCVQTEIDRSEGYKILFSIYGLSAALGSIFLSLFLLGAYFVGKQIGNSISKLATELKAYEKGDFEYRIKEISNDEVGRLAKVFNSMADKLQNLINDMEKKVGEKTSEYEKKAEEANEMNKLMVGREVKMAELKEEIERLKSKKD